MTAQLPDKLPGLALIAAERMNARGEVLTPLAEHEVADVLLRPTHAVAQPGLCPCAKRVAQ